MRVYVWTRDFELHEIAEVDVAARFLQWATADPALYECLMRFVSSPFDEGGMGATFVEDIEDIENVTDVVRGWVACIVTRLGDDTS